MTSIQPGIGEHYSVLGALLRKQENIQVVHTEEVKLIPPLGSVRISVPTRAVMSDIG